MQGEAGPSSLHPCAALAVGAQLRPRVFPWTEHSPSDSLVFLGGHTNAVRASESTISLESRDQYS
jgi:hypothetical protein